MLAVTDLSVLGWTPGAAELSAGCTRACRVSRVDRGRLTVLTADGETRLHPVAALYDESGLSGPAVGDWVAVRGERAVAVLPRTSVFVRTSSGRTSAAQVVAANLDTVLVVGALNGEARLRRVERYLAVAWSSGATPVVVLTQADLCEDVAAAVEQVREDALGVALVAVSSVTGEGLDVVGGLLPTGRTGAMVGPSGVGKSSLVNALAGESIVETGGIRESDGRGRHTTTARELHLLPGGGLLADTPGMRELALYDDGEGLDTAYADVAVLAADCRF
ncbi:MAG: ribosome small subunit-dependent GTPase, partial [Blastococcus sp.]|nr:ribosome small subunit-dependent GTPase [Blastococcus sp.]